LIITLDEYLEYPTYFSLPLKGFYFTENPIPAEICLIPPMYFIYQKNCLLSRINATAKGFILLISIIIFNLAGIQEAGKPIKKGLVIPSPFFR